MLNWILFVVSVVVCFFLAYASGLPILLLIAFLLCPFKINGNIYTVFGSAKSKGDIYSVFSLYQGGKNTYALLGSLYQKAEEDAVIFLGISLYQNAGFIAGVLAGLSVYQKAEWRAIIVFGMVIYQHSANMAMVEFGMAGYQKVGAESRYFRLCSELRK